jgi:hypothetical protein
MSASGTNGARRGKCPGCTADPRRAHTDNELREFHPRRYEFERATRGVAFAKDFLPSLEALMRDRVETSEARIMAWLKRTSWGNQSLHCINEDGTEAFQADCAVQLGIDKRRVSKVMQYLEQRGYLERRGNAKVLYPVVSPTLTGPPPDSNGKSPERATFSTFLELWKVAHSSDFFELEVARSTVERIRKVVLSDYKQWLATRTKSDAYKERDSESSERGEDAAAVSVPTPEEESVPAHPRHFPSPSQDEAPEPAPLVRLAGLRDCFPGEYMSGVALQGLDDHLVARLGGEYDRQAYVAFVARRQAKGKIRTGLVFDHEGLPHDFCEWVTRRKPRLAGNVKRRKLPNTMRSSAFRKS